MNQQRAGKNIYGSKPQCRRKMERFRLRVLEDIGNDLPELKVKRWRKTANNIEELSSVVKAATVLRGP
jgi:hypothetical protein